MEFAPLPILLPPSPARLQKFLEGFMAGRRKKILVEDVPAAPVVEADARYAGVFTHDQVLEMRRLPLGECVKFWDALESHGRKLNNFRVVSRALCLADCCCAYSP